MSRIIAVIPARYGSTRLPGKPLMDICGHPMIYWVYKRVMQSEKMNKVIVATDDERVVDCCDKHGIPSIMTSTVHRTAAERLQEVSETEEADYYVQINGDEPLIDWRVVDKVVPECIPSGIEYGTNIITQIRSPEQLMDSSNIKVVFDDNMNAIYMSRTPIPYPFKSISFTYYKHVGILGYNKKMLDFYKESKPGRLEMIEGIDTMRFIDYGKKLQFIEVDKCESLSVDTEKDLVIVRRIMGNEKQE